MKRIGLIGGTSPESTLYYYGLFVEESHRRFEKNFYPEIVIFSVNFKKFRDFPTWEEKKNYLLEGIRSLECSGAEIIALTANTPHMVFDELQKESKTRMVSIIDALAKESKRKGFKKLLLLGTKTTMTADFYRKRLEGHGLEVITPNDEEMDEVNRIIFEELALGELRSKGYLVNLVNKYAPQVDAAVLGCTELPLALKEGDTDVPLLDTVKIHVNAILRAAME